MQIEDEEVIELDPDSNDEDTYFANNMSDSRQENDDEKSSKVEDDNNPSGDHPASSTSENMIKFVTRRNRRYTVQKDGRCVNRYGRVFTNGRPLPDHLRNEILDLAEKGIRPCDIARKLLLSHGCVSKILNKYQKFVTGSQLSPGSVGITSTYKGKSVSPRLINKISELKSSEPDIHPWEIRLRLLEERFCPPENAPSISAINRILKIVNSQSLSNTLDAKSGHRELKPNFVDDISLPGLQAKVDATQSSETVDASTNGNPSVLLVQPNQLLLTAALALLGAQMNLPWETLCVGQEHRLDLGEGESSVRNIVYAGNNTWNLVGEPISMPLDPKEEPI